MASLPIRQLIAWGKLFEQKPSAIRVTAGRLVAEALLKKTARGMYTIGPGGLAMKNKAGEWATALSRIREWEGGWFGVHTAHLGKTLRRKVRARERAFRLLGFKALVSGLWVRPDNLSYSTSEMHAKLCQFGVEPQMVLMRSDDLKQSGSENPLTLWPSEEINASYGRAVELLNQSQSRLERQDLHTVTRESFVIGEHIIRQINADPLLPATHIDAAGREDMVRAMIRYSDFCHPYWEEFLGLPESAP
jgi:phenylacetic acid degradation operon negative regulatory protein